MSFNAQSSRRIARAVRKVERARPSVAKAYLYGPTPLAKYTGPFRVYVSDGSIKYIGGYITRIGVPRALQDAGDLGGLGASQVSAYCSIEYQTLGVDSISFGVALTGDLPAESRNVHIVVLADISASGIVYQRHYGDIEYIHFDRCVSCT